MKVSISIYLIIETHFIATIDVQEDDSNYQYHNNYGSHIQPITSINYGKEFLLLLFLYPKPIYSKEKSFIKKKKIDNNNYNRNYDICNYKCYKFTIYLTFLNVKHS